MATFKEVMKKSGGNIKEAIAKVSNSNAFKIVVPVGSIGSSALLTKKRLNQEKRLHKEQIENLVNLSDDIKDLGDRVSSLEEDLSPEEIEKLKKKTKFKKKKFSLEAGGFKKEDTRQVVSEGMKRIAEESKLRSTEDSSENLLEVAKEVIGDDSIYKNDDPMLVACDNFKFISIHQKGDVLVMFLRYMSQSDITKLNKILDSYCETFTNTDYSSNYLGTGEYCVIEVWIPEGSLKYLIKKLAEHYKINIIE